MLTGQLIFRDAGLRAPDGRRLMMVVGVVAVDESNNLNTETRYTVSSNDHTLGLSLDVEMPGEDLSEDTRIAMANAGQLLLMPIWRV
jgi:hypothetical protein